MREQNGFSLSEVLISLFLASIIMTMLTQFYLSIKRQYIQAQEVLAVSFDLQWVSDLLSDSIRRAGFTPCLGIDQLKVIDRRNFPRVISGLKVQNKPQQSIQVNRMSEVFTQAVTIHSSTELIVSDSIVFHEQRPLIIADCEHAEVHQLFGIEPVGSGYLITLAKPLMFSYGSSASVGEWLEEKWYIKSNAKGIRALYYQMIQTEELTSLVHSLQIKEQRVHERRLIEIIMGLDQDNTQQVLVAVRGS